jgi:hypothetical protein
MDPRFKVRIRESKPSILNPYRSFAETTVWIEDRDAVPARSGLFRKSCVNTLGRIMATRCASVERTLVA